MIIKYEGSYLEVDLKDKYHQTFLKNKIKKYLGFWIGKPYKRDDYLEFAFEILRKNMSNNCTVFDIGCNIGATVFPIASRFPNVKMVAVDAHPLASGRFFQNIKLNKLSNVNFIVAAIASQDSDLIPIYTCPQNSGGHRVTGFKGREDLGDETVTSTFVPSLRMDTIIKKFGTGVLLKIDVEGFECQVLKSMGEFLSPVYFPNIICEYGPEGLRAAGFSVEDMLIIMKNRGYSCLDLHSKKTINQAEDVPLLKDFEVTDFLFFPSNK